MSGKREQAVMCRLRAEEVKEERGDMGRRGDLHCEAIMVWAGAIRAGAS